MLSQALFVPSATARSPRRQPDLSSTPTRRAGAKTFTFDQKTYSTARRGRGPRAPERRCRQVSWPGGFGDQNDDPRGSVTTTRSSTAIATAARSTSRREGHGRRDAERAVRLAGVSDPFFAAVSCRSRPRRRPSPRCTATRCLEEIKRAGMSAPAQRPRRRRICPS